MRLAWTLPLGLFERSHCETPPWKQNFHRGSVQAPEEGKATEVWLSEKGNRNSKQKIPDPCKPRVILSVRRED